MTGDVEIKASEQDLINTQESQSADEADVHADGEPSAPASDEARLPSWEELASQLEEVRAKADDNWDKFLRAQADSENIRRRFDRDLQNAHKFSLEAFAKELLNVVDSLELGIQAASVNSPEVKKLKEGSELTLKQLQTVLEKFNIVPVDPLGESFNPERHQAMSMQVDPNAQPNTVIKVFQKGYLLHERLLRPAMVIVAQADPSKTPKIDEQA